MTRGPATVDLAAQRDPWEQQGHDIAAALKGASAAVVLGANPDFAARVALGIARATCAARHVAVADLVGDLAPLYALTGGADALGLSDCFRDGLPLNDVARPAPEWVPTPAGSTAARHRPRRLWRSRRRCTGHWCSGPATT